MIRGICDNCKQWGFLRRGTSADGLRTLLLCRECERKPFYSLGESKDPANLLKLVLALVLIASAVAFLVWLFAGAP